MTVDIDFLLSRVRMVPMSPYTDQEIAAAEERIAIRVAAHTPETRSNSDPDMALPSPEECRTPESRALSLRSLCEAFITRPEALSSLREFVADAMPEPRGARVLGGILYLAHCEDSARFWWQYAAGASDALASYCLYLHHRSLGEKAEADWWLDHASFTPATLSTKATRLEIDLALHVLTSMRRWRPQLPERAQFLIQCVPAAVGFVDDDLELPLPDCDFVELIESIVGEETPGAGKQRVGVEHLSPRAKCSAPPAYGSRRTRGEWALPVQDALRDCEETVSC
ncbi:hypothetical protein [Streptomyces boncukensis]|uniref:Uncharacterized protein n=1 Tax=Streptomyces boncukensis TaxID=2711219 RepID=A0A6G4X4S9_9ACTN|nr:hypothetical protein [Streptomyces boncukensis]NGO71857.1 hypothetical protein [Streptomyces boncukensis]